MNGKRTIYVQITDFVIVTVIIAIEKKQLLQGKCTSALSYAYVCFKE